MSTNPTTFLRSENTRLQDENKQLNEELRNLRDFVRMLERLTTITARVKGDDEIMPALDTILQMALKLLNAPDGSLALMDDDTYELVFVLAHGDLGDDLVGHRFPAGQGIAGWVVENKEVALVRDVRRDSRFYSGVDDQFKFRTQSIAAAPLVGDGRVLGVIEVLNQPGDTPFTRSNVSLLKLLCHFAGEALANIERKRLQDG